MVLISPGRNDLVLFAKAPGETPHTPTMLDDNGTDHSKPRAARLVLWHAAGASGIHAAPSSSTSRMTPRDPDNLNDSVAWRQRMVYQSPMQCEKPASQMKAGMQPAGVGNDLMTGTIADSGGIVQPACNDDLDARDAIGRAFRGLFKRRSVNFGWPAAGVLRAHGRHANPDSTCLCIRPADGQDGTAMRCRFCRGSCKLPWRASSYGSTTEKPGPVRRLREGVAGASEMKRSVQWNSWRTPCRMRSLQYRRAGVCRRGL